uniref:Uncharacterized protein n=1 Tax=Arundo donax TaxID=35708 RepID=A0A0A9HKZ1_ARUDO
MFSGIVIESNTDTKSVFNASRVWY